eukprot:COSAG02_NODE_75_length_41389_cov_106.665762_16_plen_39_part_00
MREDFEKQLAERKAIIDDLRSVRHDHRHSMLLHLLVSA